MNQLFGLNPKVLHLLSIGSRGVGKTVFLAGSHAELNTDQYKSKPQRLWFDCQDLESRKNIEGVHNYVARTGLYPPPTLKIESFTFSLKRQNLWGTQTLCYFRWWDMPGEKCNTDNREFQTMVLGSHGCCVFLNGDALVRDSTYLQSLEDTVELVVAISSLVKQNNLKYPIALVFTQCDKLEAGPLGHLQIEKRLEPLITRLEVAKAKYKRFYSEIPIVSTEGTPALQSTGGADAFLWLTSELSKTYNAGAWQDLASRLSQSDSANRSLRLAAPRVIIGLLLLASVGVIAAALLNTGRTSQVANQAQAPDQKVRQYEQILEREPENLDVLTSLANLHLELGQLDQAVPLFEKIIKQEPEKIDWHMNLAELYELTGQKQKAETAYDQILSKQTDNLRAIVGKAVLRNEQGDTQTAQALFTKAEGLAVTSEAKAKIREISQQTLTQPSD